ncbi:MAG: hypothetical protein IJV92_00165 [Phascolarctobacterium sp.]|nr:hypothetical protein [Phascolarctobacterium sp.]
MNPISIFEYVKNNIDEEGRFASEVLPDDPSPNVPRPLGAEDAYFYTTEVPPDTEGAENTVKFLKQYIAIPCLESKRRFNEHLRKIFVAALCDAFLEKFTADELTPEVMELAEENFYNATHREQVKFSMIIFGLYGMQSIKEQLPDLWHDLVTIARCEEFTFFFLYACRTTQFAPQEEIWQLLHCTNSWGKVYAINAAEFDTPGKQQWLLENGYDMTIEYPPLSVKMIKESKLAEVLEADKIGYDAYKGAAAILNNFLLLLNNFAPEVVEENFNTTSIDLEQLLTNFLRHAKDIATKPEELLDVVGLCIGLNNLVDSENWYKLSANQCHTIIAACDKLIYQTDWQEYLDTNLISNAGEINYTLCEFAYEVDIDIWPRLYSYFSENPAEIKLLPFLLSSSGDDRYKKVLNVVEENIYQYLTDKFALNVPLKFLHNHPDEGVSIIIAALHSIYDWPRGLACMVLEEWGHEHLTPALRHALLAAQELNQHPVVNARIEALLTGKSFNLEELVPNDLT